MLRFACGEFCLNRLIRCHRGQFRKPKGVRVGLLFFFNAAEMRLLDGEQVTDNGRVLSDTSFTKSVRKLCPRRCCRSGIDDVAGQLSKLISNTNIALTCFKV